MSTKIIRLLTPSLRPSTSTILRLAFLVVLPDVSANCNRPSKHFHRRNMTSISQDESFISLIRKSFPSSIPSSPTQSDFSKLSSVLYPDVHYSDHDKTEISQWLITSSHIASPTGDQAKTDERLLSLNTHLSTRTTLLGSKPSVADIALYARMEPVVSKWLPEERTGERGYHHIVRHLDFVQNAPLFGLQVSEDARVKIDPDDVRVAIKPIDARAEKDRKKKEKEAAAAGATAAAAAGGTQTTLADRTAKLEQADGSRKGKKDEVTEKPQGLGEVVAAAVGAGTPGVTQPSAGSAENSVAAPPQPQKRDKKEKKEKQPKPAKTTPAEKPLSPSLIDLRVGHILKAIPHPNADSLYVSTIACGDPPGTENTSEHEGKICRTVCSGLNGLIPLEEMQGRKIVAVCNLKPVTMRGIKSTAMVLAASPRAKEGEEDNHKGPVELVDPPSESEAGERVYFEGWRDGEPEQVLNPKKKVWETLQPGFVTTEGREVGFDVGSVEALREEAVGGREKVGRLRTKDGYCTVKSLVGASVR